MSHNMANIFLISHILLLFHSPKISQQYMRNLENIGHIVLGTLRQLMHVEENSINFLHTKIVKRSKNIWGEVYLKTSKLPIHCSTGVPKWYKQNCLLGDLWRWKTILTLKWRLKLMNRIFTNLLTQFIYVNVWTAL